MTNGLRIRLVHNPRVEMLGVIVLALAVRLIGIKSRPIWYDEAFSILFAEKGPAAALTDAASRAGAGTLDVHPLGYYVILWEWMRVFGETLISIRMLSVIAGVGAVLVAYLLARGLFGRGTAFAAGIIAALSPFQVHYGQEIRMYGFLCLWLLLATYCYWRGSRSKGWAWWMGFAAFAAMAEYTQYLAAFYLVALAAWPVLTRDWRALRNVVTSALLSIVLCLPWLIDVPAQFASVDRTYWIDRPGLYRLLTLALVFVTNLPLPGWQLAAGLFIALCVVSLALLQTAGAVLRREPDNRMGLWLLYLAIIPPLLLFLFSQWIPIYLERALLPSGAMFCAWLAWSIVATHPPRAARQLTVILLTAGFAMGLYEHVTYAGFPYGPFGSIAQSLEARHQAGDTIIHSSKLSMLPTVYYDRSLPETFVADPPGSPVDTLAPGTQKTLGLEAQRDIESAAGNADRVWFILFNESNQEYVRAGYPEHPHLGWLMAHYHLIEDRNWGDVSVYLFSKSK
jgi:4-amino-4-deoxy-L-arabinose transferase-like glycosyltransferase